MISIKYIFWALFISLLTVTAQADSLLIFKPQVVTKMTWGTGKGQVGLIRAPANNFGPPRLLLDETGTSLYLFDAPNQRMVVFNLSSQQLSYIFLATTDTADDFCVLDEGRHFYLLFNQQKQVVLYNSQGEQLRVYPLTTSFKPLSMQCNRQRGLTFLATDGHYYHFNDDEPLTLMPMENYGFFLDKHGDKEGTLWLHHYENDLSEEIAIQAQHGVLETLDLLGVDQQQLIYLTVEETEKQGNNEDVVRRFLRQYNQDGQLLAEVEIPYSLFAYTLQDLVVSATGEVFQLVPDREQLKIVKWMKMTPSRSATRAGNILYAQLFSSTDLQPDDFLPSEAPSNENESSLSRGYYPPLERNTIIKRARKFLDYQYYASKSNITRGRYVGGKKVVTPIEKPGRYQGIPYKWGGFDDLDAFQAGLKQGKYAGDRCAKRCSGKYFGSIAAVGIDCSGFVSQVWGLKDKASTHTLPSISKRLSSFSDLERGDILNKKGHVRLFSHRDIKGGFWLYEASSDDWRVDIHKYSSYQLKTEGYKPYRYKNIRDVSYNPSHPLPPTTPVYKKPRRFYIYGKRSIREGRTSRYRAKIFYTDGTHRDVTHLARWSERSRYVYFKGARLHTKRVRRNRYAYVKAFYREGGQSFAAGTSVTIRNWGSRGFQRGPGAIVDLPSATAEPLNIDVKYVYYPQDKGKVNNLIDGQFLYSGDRYQIIFTPTEKAYLYVFQTDSSQKISRLFPMEKFNEMIINNLNPVMPNKTDYIPAANQAFVLDNQIGEETIYFIAARQPLTELEQEYEALEKAQQEKSSELELAQTQFFDQEIRGRGFGGLMTITPPANQTHSSLEHDEQKTTFRQRLKICQGCVKVLKFWHR